MSKKYAEIGVLVARAQAGSKAAAETLLLTFKPLILATISEYIYDKTQLEDAYQEACVIFMERLKDFKSERLDYFPAYIKKQRLSSGLKSGRLSRLRRRFRWTRRWRRGALWQRPFWLRRVRRRMRSGGRGRKERTATCFF